VRASAARSAWATGRGMRASRPKLAWNNDLAKEMAGQNNTSANRLRRNLFVSLLGILLLWLGACAAPARPPHLIATVTSDPKTFNTYLAAESSSRDAIAYLEAGLVTLDEDTLLPKPELAEGWEVSEDGLRMSLPCGRGCAGRMESP